MRCVNVIICAAAGSRRCVCWISESMRWSARWSGAWRPSAVVSETLSRIARALARRRVPLGFGAGALVFWFAAPTPASLVVGTSIAVAGEVIRIWAAGHLNKAREVTASGPYRWFAHPLYIGSSVIGAGLAIACASLVVLAIVAIYLGVTLPAAVRNEEAFLRRTFGDQYERYRRGDGRDTAGDTSR